MSDLTLTRPLLEAANAAKAAIAFLPSEKKKALLLTMADCLEADTQTILEANELLFDQGFGTLGVPEELNR